MDLMLRKDFQKLMFDAEKVQVALETLENDHAAWSIECQQNDLTQLIEYVQRLELDVIMMLADCISLTSQYQKRDGTEPVLDSLHCAFANLNTLFNDLKKARVTLKQAYIHPSEIQQLVIDWGRFKKALYQIQIQHHQKGRKKNGHAPTAR